jgi:hypothetical protein
MIKELTVEGQNAFSRKSTTIHTHQAIEYYTVLYANECLKCLKLSSAHLMKKYERLETPVALSKLSPKPPPLQLSCLWLYLENFTNI